MNGGSERSARVAWRIALPLAVASRAWNALTWPLMSAYDPWGHVSYALFIDLYRAIPYADQGWSYFHPPLHYLFGFLLAQAGDAELLVRGLGLVSSAASLGVAALTGWIVRRALPERPLLAPLAFVAVAFLPVHVYTSPMPGNEQTAAFFATLGYALFVRNQLRARPTRAGDLSTGIALGLALLAKFSGLLPLLGAGGTLAWSALRSGGGAGAWGVALRRGAAIGLSALAVCGPYYARNVAAFGDPFPMSRSTPLVEKVESVQLPGERSWLDFVMPAPRALVDPDVLAPHLLHSVWGSVYVHVWSGATPAVAPAPRWTRTVPLWLGLLPTALAAAGLALTLRRTLRQRDAAVEPALIALVLLNLAAFTWMAWRVPTWAILKASYLLQLSLPYGYLLARSLEALWVGGWRRAARSCALWILCAAAVAAIALLPGVGIRRGADVRLAAVHDYFGNHERARAIYRANLQRVLPTGSIWLREALAGSLLLAGRAEDARRLYAAVREARVGDVARMEARSSPWVANRLAVASALAGDHAAARALLDELLAREHAPELLVNRATLRALEGDGEGAESDLRAALARDARLAPAWHDLAWLLERRGDAAGAADALREAERLARAAPRGFPYGLGDGYHIGGQRFMLVLDGDALALYRPARARAARPQGRRSQT